MEKNLTKKKNGIEWKMKFDFLKEYRRLTLRQKRQLFSS